MANCINCGKKLNAFNETYPLWDCTEDKLCSQCREKFNRLISLKQVDFTAYTDKLSFLQEMSDVLHNCGFTSRGINYLGDYAEYRAHVRKQDQDPVKTEEENENKTVLTEDTIRQDIRKCREDAIKTLKSCAFIHVPLSAVSIVLYLKTEHTFFAYFAAFLFMFTLKHAFNEGFIVLSAPEILREADYSVMEKVLSAGNYSTFFGRQAFSIWSKQLCYIISVKKTTLGIFPVDQYSLSGKLAETLVEWKHGQEELIKERTRQDFDRLLEYVHRHPYKRYHLIEAGKHIPVHYGTDYEEDNALNENHLEYESYKVIVFQRDDGQGIIKVSYHDLPHILDVDALPAVHLT